MLTLQPPLLCQTQNKLQFLLGLSCPAHAAQLPWASPCLHSLSLCLSHQPTLFHQPSQSLPLPSLPHLPNLALLLGLISPASKREEQRCHNKRRERWQPRSGRARSISLHANAALITLPKHPEPVPTVCRLGRSWEWDLCAQEELR